MMEEKYHNRILNVRKLIEKCYKKTLRWDLANKGNCINDMILNKLVSNLHYLINSSLTEETLKKCKVYKE